MAILRKRIEMRTEFDIAGYSPTRELVLIAEVKWLKESSEENAVYFRRNLLSHRLLSEVPYFLLAYRSSFFLWRGASDPGASPDFKAPAKPVLKKYLGTFAESESGPGPESMESAVNLWLSELASGIQEPDPSSEPDKMILDSGLYDRIKGGEVRRQMLE
jgi:hypothetical protein